MKIIEVKENKKQYLDLLLLADEQEDMVDRYLDNGKMYVLDDNGVKCECVITDKENDILEIKNIATVPEYQGKGYARALIEFIVNNYREQYAILQVGTGDSLCSFLLTCVEWMTFGADFYVDVLFSRTCYECVTTVAGYSCLIIIRMDSFSHDFHLSIRFYFLFVFI